MPALVFRLCDNAPEILRDVCLERGWKEYEEDEDEDGSWNLWWKSSGFRSSDFESCRPWQRINHFPKSNSITRKDTLARNLRRMKGVYGSLLFNFAPLSFNLPNDYRKFVTEYSKDKNSKKLLWICKPADQSRGKGIFLFRNLTDLTYDCATVVQQYIQNPLLIAGYKFDLRLYVLVTSFHPLRIYLYHEGLARFGTDKFDLNSLDNVYSHLTNTSINKQSPYYATDKERIGSGCKWSLSQLRTYFYQHNVDDKLLWNRITAIVILTLVMQAPEVQKETANCFELFGFDILIDSNLKPWLLEVNFSPSLGVDCTLDTTIKKALLEDTLKAINLKESDIIPCSLNGCITKVKTCIRNQTSLSRTSSKHLFHPHRSQLLSSSRLNTRSRLSRTSCSLVSRISKEKFEGENLESSSCLEEEASNAETSIETDRDESISNSLDSIIGVGESSCSTTKEGTEEESSNRDMNDSEISCCDCTPQKSCQAHSRVESSLSQSNASLEFRRAYSHTKPPRRAPSPLCQERKSSISKTDSTPKESSITAAECGDHASKSSIPSQSQPKKAQLTQLPPLKRSIRKASGFPFGKRSTKVMPYLPAKGKEIPTKSRYKLSLVNDCSCSRRASHSLVSYKMIPAKQIGDYLLVFPFNEATQKACTLQQLNCKDAINEVKKAIKKLTNMDKSQSNAKSLTEDVKEKLDLNKPFFGFSALFNWPS